MKIWNTRTVCRLQNFSFYVLLAVSVGIRFPHVFKELSPYQFCDEDIWLTEVQRMVAEKSFVPNQFLSGSLSVIPAFLISQLTKLTIGRELNGNELTVAVRVVLIHGSVIAAAFIYRKLLRTLLRNEWTVICGLAILLLNPSSLAFSLYWYPDHYIIFPAVFFYYSVVAAITNKMYLRNQWILIGVAWAVLVSTKYTALLAATMLIPLLISEGRISPLRTSSTRVFRRVALVFAVFMSSFLLLNYGILFNLSKFLEDFLFNFNNYSRFQGGVQSLLFYLYTTIVSPYGLVSLPLFILGVASIFRQNKVVGWSLVSFPVLLVVSLSRSGFTISRNTAVLIPITSTFLICGIQEALTFGKKFTRILRPLIFTFTAIALSFPAAESISQLEKSIEQDSRLIASKWISENIPAYASIGTNEGCSGASPADTAGLSTTRDPMMELQLDFYVINSFWNSPISRYYESTSDQRYFHFYRFLGYGNPLFRQSFDIAGLIPPNYYEEITFSGDGPEIVVLRRVND